MGLMFRKSKKLMPGVRLNLSRSGAGLSLGGKGLRYSFSTSGRRAVTASVPGTGIYYSKTLSSGSSGGKRSAGSSRSSGKPPQKKPFYKRKWFILLLLIFFAPVGIFLFWKFWGTDSKPVKIGVSIAAAAFFLIMMSGDTESESDGSLPDESGSSISASVSDTSTEESSAEIKEPESSESAEESSVIESSNTAESSEDASEAEPSSEVSSSASSVPPASSSESSSVSGDAAQNTAPEGMKNVVFWGNSGTKYHIDPDCWTFDGNTPNSGTIDQAKALGRSEWCGSCSKGWTDAELESRGNPNV